MKFVKDILPIILLGLGVMLLQGVALGSTATTSSGTDTSYFYVLHANRASITKSAASNNVVTYTLSMPNPDITFFTERPMRQDGHIRPENFVARWNDEKNGYTVTPPNAITVGLEGQTNSGDYIDRVIMVTNPQYNNGTLSFSISKVDNRPVATVNDADITLIVDDIEDS